MALNKYMHPRNLYKTKKANFQLLAIKYPEFRKHVFPDVSGKLFLDFKNPESLRQLSVTLMKDDFGLDVELPPDRLVPTIPLRLNYILWIEDILQDSNLKGEIKGIDIGTGASCVYPLLSTRMNKWNFLATEVDEINFHSALKNIKKNKMEDFIQVQKVDENAILLDAIKDKSNKYDFCMCNPPFFSDHLEAQGITTSRTDDRSEPSSVNTASATESVAFGGEVEFVKKIIKESLDLQLQVRIYTSMVGKKVSLIPLKEELRKHQITNFSTTEFCQGKTMRWGIGWSFDETVKFPKSEFKEKKKDKRPPLSYIVPEDIPELMYTTEGVAYRIKQYLKELQIKCEEKKSNEIKISMVITANKNTWSHQRRKRRKRKDTSDNQNVKERDDVCSADSNQTESSKGLLTSISNRSSEVVSKKRKLSDETDGVISSKFSKIDDNSGNFSTQKIEKVNDITEDTCITEHISDISKTTAGEANKNSNEFIKQGKGDKQSSSSDSVMKNGTTEFVSYEFKCNLLVKQIEDEQIVIEMSWIDGTVRESMNQVMQYFKNKLKAPT